MTITKSTWRLLVGLTCLFLSPYWGPFIAQAQAQTHADAENLVYQVRSGDTLSELVHRYTEGEGVQAQIVQLNRLRDLHRIAPLQKIKIPRHLLRYTPSVATVTWLNCVKVRQIDGDDVKKIQNGSIVGEGDVLRIPAGCQFALTLEDQSILRLMSGALIQIKTLRRNAIESSPEVKIELLDGRIDIRVPRQRGRDDAPFEILTPASVAGVRGTEFRVSFDARSRLSQVAVSQGVVGARGLLEREEKRLLPGQAVVVTSQGQSLAAQSWMSAPRYAGAQAQPGTADWWVKLAPMHEADFFILKTSDDVMFSAISEDVRLSEGQFKIHNLQRTAAFYQWSAVSAQGLIGQEANVAICLAYQRQGSWRCNVSFELPPLVRPRLRLEKWEPSGQVLSVYDAVIHPDQDHHMVFQALPEGRYRWQLEYEVSALSNATHQGASSTQGVLNGQFELLAIPGNE